MKIEINKIITLGNQEKYLVIDKVVHNDIEYYYVAEVNEDETKSLNNANLLEIDEQGNTSKPHNVNDYIKGITIYDNSLSPILIASFIS